MITTKKPQLKRGLILLILFSMHLSVKAQSFQKLDPYSSFAISVQGLAYLKGDYTRTEGNYPIKSNYLYSWQAGVRYTILGSSSPWGLSTGFYIGWPPVYSHTVTIKKEDLFTPSTDDAVLLIKTSSTYSVVIPLTVEYKRKIVTNHYAAISAGVQGMWLGIGQASSSYVMVDEDAEREVFVVEASNEEPGYYYSTLLGVGDYFTSQAGLFYIGLEYSKSFQTLMSGRYKFANLKVSPDTKGTYKLDGDYLALTLRYSWKRKER